MKALTKIIKVLLLAAVLFLSLKDCIAQHQQDVSKTKTRFYLASETFSDAYGNDCFRITTTNFDVKEMLDRKLKDLIVHQGTVKYIDKYGEYEEWIYIFNQKDTQRVIYEIDIL